MIDWPASLPPCPVRGMVRQFRPAAIAFATAVGPGKQRAQSTAVVKPHEITLLLTRAQAVLFEEFYYTDLKQGTLPFNWRDPLTLTAASFRFPVGSPPSLVERSANRWELSATVEILP